MISSDTFLESKPHQQAYVLAERVMRDLQTAKGWQMYKDCVKLLSTAYQQVFPGKAEATKPLPDCLTGALVHELQAMHCPYGLKLACLQHNEDNLRDAIKDYAQRILWQFANPNNQPVTLPTA